MKQYHQPDFYRFNEDSIQLVNFAIRYCLQQQRQPREVLDLCSGCGIVGLDFLEKWSHQINKLTFIEANKKFAEYLENNQKLSQQHLVGLSMQNIFEKFQNCLPLEEFKNAFDLILCNPPYYDESDYRFSPNSDNRMARSFQPPFLDELIQFLRTSLKHDGVALFLFHNSNLKTLLQYEHIKQLETVSVNVSLFSMTSFE